VNAAKTAQRFAIRAQRNIGRWFLITPKRNRGGDTMKKLKVTKNERRRREKAEHAIAVFAAVFIRGEFALTLRNGVSHVGGD
jgi:hypothetical protein